MFGLRSRRIGKLLPAVVLVAFVLPATAFGQATRTWVSGVGDDANPCSRTAPCKTFAGAISKTATGGIINAMDDGGFGALTITKSITVDGGHHTAGMLASGGINAVNVNIAGSAGQVVLRNLDIEGNGTTLGLNGVNIISAKSVRIENSQIFQFSRSGILMASIVPLATLVVIDTQIHNNGGGGVTVAPPAAGNPNRAKIYDSRIQENTCGLIATTFGMSNVFATDCGTSPSSGPTAGAIITAVGNAISFNTSVGVFSRGSGGNIRIGNNDISGNIFGLRVLDAGAQITSLGGNLLNGGNNTDGAPTGTQGPI